MVEELNGSNLQQKAIDLGASVVGFCEGGELINQFHPEIREIAQKLSYAISIGIALQKAVLESIEDRPNEIYKTHYQATNTQLDNITWQLSAMLSEAGYNALPIPASKIVQRYPLIAHVSHREIAYRAGIGWRGKNNLLVNGKYGARLRLTTVLTDFRLEPDKTTTSDCGKCKACLKKCPVEAIGDSPEDFDLERCRKQVKYFSRENNYGHLICGLCLNSCPVKKGKEVE